MLSGELEEVCHSIRNLGGRKLCLLANGTFLKTFRCSIPSSFRSVTLGVNDEVMICAGVREKKKNNPKIGCKAKQIQKINSVYLTLYERFSVCCAVV